MDDEQAICLAKTEFREAFNCRDLERLLAVFSDDLVNMSEGEPSFFGRDAKLALRLQTEKLLSEFDVQLGVAMIMVRVYGDAALDIGWHNLALTPRNDGRGQSVRYRYAETWARQPDNQWKIAIYMTSREHPPKLLEP